jgi:hypothetical protein
MEDRLAEHIIDQHGGEIEVWLTEDGKYVALYELDAEVGGFWLGQPCGGDPLQVTAQRVASGEAKRLTVFVDDDFDVIDRADRYKTLHVWPGDGKVH